MALGILLFLILVGLACWGIFALLDFALGKKVTLRVRVVGRRHQPQSEPDFDGNQSPEEHYLIVKAPKRQIEVKVSAKMYYTSTDYRLTLSTTIGKWSNQYYFPQFV